MRQGPPHGFPDAEFETRTTRAQEKMRAAGMDGMVVTTSHDVRYFTGFDSQFWESPTRPWFVLIPADGNPVAVVPDIGAPQFAATWLDDVRSWPAPVPEDDGTSLLVDAIGALPRRFGKIGFELGREQALRMPTAQFLDLRDRLAGAEAVDASPLIWALRQVKSDGEIDRIRHACQVACDAYDRVPALVRIGDTDRDAMRKVRIELLANGADAVPFLPVIAGPGGVDQIVCGPNGREIQDGDVLFMDTGATYDGYFCDFDRTWAAGDISDDAKRAQDAVWRAVDAGIAAAVPGATTDDVHRAMAAVVDQAGSIGNNVGRMGHGLGLQLTEPPSNRPGDGTLLTPGTVLTVEPGMEYAPGKMIVHEENLVVREDGPELLTRRAPREMPVLS